MIAEQKLWRTRQSQVLTDFWFRTQRRRAE